MTDLGRDVSLGLVIFHDAGGTTLCYDESMSVPAWGRDIVLAVGFVRSNLRPL